MAIRGSGFPSEILRREGLYAFEEEVTITFDNVCMVKSRLSQFYPSLQKKTLDKDL